MEKYTEINRKIISELKFDFKVQTFFIVILIVLAILLCFYCKKLKIDNKSLKKEALEEYIELENMNFGGNVE